MPSNLVYSTIDLIQVVPNLKTAQSFLLDRFFPNIITSDSEEVAIDVDIGKRRMAPFVSPLVEGKLVEQRRFQTNTFKPAYIKDKRAPDLLKPVRRMIGERIGGDLKGIEREMANLEAEMTDQVDILTRRLEWMAASALRLGQVTIEGEGFETVIVDFGRASDLTVALTSNRKWTAANVAAGTASPTRDIETWATRILKRSGATTSDLVFTPSSWAGFILDPALKGAIVLPAQASFGNVINPGAEVKQGAVYKGKWGQFDLWLYNDWFVDENDTERPMLYDGDVIMSGPNLQGTRAFGQIMDPAFNYQSLPFAPKTWVQEDPAQRLLMMQSSPIVIPSRVNACLSANVCDPAVE
ncbi:major capsid protein [Achromobacter denitrificans]|uniref:major capsid protein n=1 Tax=Achromobacter denitrificans TaxID=32002 RepID=UPI000F4F8A59|nr:major capsid protein [Achromobacter denitrificans]MBV2161414.1 major capsid protein [Achromobacter denitrificans]QCS64420.1 major capsid protein [Achromobacter denitrificans]